MGIDKLRDFEYVESEADHCPACLYRPDGEISVSVDGDSNRHIVADIYGVGEPRRPVATSAEIGPLLAAGPPLHGACKRLLAALARYGHAIDDLFGDDEDFGRAIRDIEEAIKEVDEA